MPRRSPYWLLQAFAILVGGIFTFIALFLAGAMGTRNGRELTFCRLHDLVIAQRSTDELRVLGMVYGRPPSTATPPGWAFVAAGRSLVLPLPPGRWKLVDGNDDVEMSDDAGDRVLIAAEADGGRPLVSPTVSTWLFGRPLLMGELPDALFAHDLAQTCDPDHAALTIAGETVLAVLKLVPGLAPLTAAYRDANGSGAVLIFMGKGDGPWRVEHGFKGAHGWLNVTFEVKDRARADAVVAALGVAASPDAAVSAVPGLEGLAARASAAGF